uniref:C3H1-type domain-containing protein n=1 Tax=Kwoniella pini CBS 10737 TaxID=1296096 RepID=A0A1B9ICR5_9TREE|nr:uncharacterized protein I206_00628 [Kwoniella pini CBS 10737]OCF53326.1 hypothetical protein I206_00628 [Kwoniella pini CBS 10737]
MFTDFITPMSNDTISQVRFASIEIDRQSPPAYNAASEDIDNSIEIDLSSLLSQAQKQQQERSSSSTKLNFDIGSNSRIRRKWEDIPATAFGNILRVRNGQSEDDDITPTNSTMHVPFPNLKVGLPEQPKTAPLRLWREFQPLNELYSAPLTPQYGQTSSLQPPPIAEQAGLTLPTSSDNRPLKLGTTSTDNVNNVKNHLEGLSIHLEGLFDQVKQLEEMKKEVKYWKDVCLGLEIGKKDLEVVLAQTQKQQIESKFAVLLIDGDQHIFHESLLQAGYEGGQEAAKTLLRVAGTARETTKVLVQIFVNKSTMGATLIKNGIIQTWAKYDSFWQGFSAFSGFITVCDLGSGSEKAEQKIEVRTDYPRDLGGTVRQPHNVSISRSQAHSSANILHLSSNQNTSIGSEKIFIPDLFQTVELIPLTAKPAVPAKPKGPEDQIEVYDWATYGTPCDIKGNEKHQDKIKISSISVSSQNTSSGDDLSPKRKFRKQTKYNKVAAEQVRKLEPRPCHTHYLSEWGCRDVDACSYGHGYHLNNAQLGELSRMAKSVICPYMKDGRCRYDDQDCVYGHKCPSASKCPFGEGCRFHSIPNGHGELD